MMFYFSDSVTVSQSQVLGKITAIFHIQTPSKAQVTLLLRPIASSHYVGCVITISCHRERLVDLASQ